jgi:hypothetical protein
LRGDWSINAKEKSKMKAQALLVLLVAIASPLLAAPQQSKVVRNIVQCPNNDNSEYVSLPHPEDCTSFFKCDWGQPILFHCPDGLHFNPTIQVCDWPHSAGCTAGQKPSTAEPPVETEKPTSTAAPATDAPATEEPTTLAPETEAPETEAPATEAPATEAPETEAPETEAPETEAPETEAPETEAPETEAPETEAPATEAPATEAPATEGHHEVTEAPVEEGICPANGVSLAPNPADCETFYVCNFGHAILVTCPEFTAFDKTHLTCTEHAQLECPKSLCPDEGSAIVANPDSCDTFYFCMDGEPMLLTCPARMAFDSVIESCSEAAMLDCTA